MGRVGIWGVLLSWDGSGWLRGLSRLKHIASSAFLDTLGWRAKQPWQGGLPAAGVGWELLARKLLIHRPFPRPPPPTWSGLLPW